MASIQAQKAQNGKKTYYVVVCVSDKHKWVKAGTLQQAKVLKREIEALQESQRIEKLGLTRRDKRIDDFFQEYMDYLLLRTAPNTVKRYKAAVNAFLVFLILHYPRVQLLGQIQHEHIENYQLRRSDSVELKVAADGNKPGNHKNKQLPKPQTVNYEVGVLRSAFLWAQDRELIASVPTSKVKKLKPLPTKRARVLTPPECKLFLKTARELSEEDKGLRIYRFAFQFLLNTGLRSGELCSLTWDDVDLTTGLIKTQPKTGWTPKSNAREFFLNSTCLSILKRLKPYEGIVFKTDAGGQIDTDSLRRVLISIAKSAGIAELTRVHDLRHTFSSLMQMRGVDPGTVAAILGHRDLGTTRIYTHQTQEHLKQSVNKIGIK